MARNDLCLITYFIHIKSGNKVKIMFHSSVKAVIEDHVVLVLMNMSVLSVMNLKLPVSEKKRGEHVISCC